LIKKTITLGNLFIALILTSTCLINTQVKGIEVNITFLEEELSDNLLTNMEYTWKTTSEFKTMKQDMIIFLLL